ncbi:SpaA isopeptide-forming pilin-related protein [Clostridium sp.]|uniref:SpaA isopeptide-forming pilin-related protein n=1 Tax=Clostridium sp. TaxID=1506 RepID=UPI001D7FE21C|nr:SpaA isopeptide-forming pilin-related protein [Clostridium sp.]MBS5938558.1 LPXTG cell wall anchor domain-containing protein [Clostridium sp.]
MKKTRKVAFTVLVLFIMQLFSGISHGDIVKAEENKVFNFLTNVEVTDLEDKPLEKEIDKSSDVRIKYHFAIPNVGDVKSGDTFTVNLPKQIAIKNTIYIDINYGKEIVAKTTINTDGRIDIVFTEFAATHSDIEGYFYIDTIFDRNNIDNGESEKIEFSLGGETEPVVIEVEFKQDPIPETSIVKSGSYEGNKNEITWKIEFNNENVNLKNPIITDNIPFGQEYIKGTAKIDNSEDTSGFSYSEADSSDKEKSGTLTYTFNGETNKKHIISFNTRISDTSILPKEQGEIIKLYNKAILDINGDIKESNEASVDVKANYIEKIGNYNSNEKKIDWTINVNSNALELNNLKVEDVIPDGLELISDSFKVNNELNSNYIYENNKLTYTFNGKISTKQMITFSTKVVDEKVYLTNDTTNYENTATIVEGLEGTPSGSYTVGVGSNILKKSALGYNTSNHHISWQIEVNSNEVNIENPVVTDKIPKGQKYVDGSFKIDGPSLNDSKFSYEPSEEGDTDETGTITYSFNEAINEKYIITFQTEVTDSSIYAGNVSKDYSNTAYMMADNISKEVNSTANQNVTSNVIHKQSLSYNSVEKEITWEITVNKNKTKLDKVVVTDNIKIGQEYVEGSAEIVKSPQENINNNAEKSGFVYTKANKDEKEITGTLEYTFKDEISDTYVITFKTRITDDSIFYTNGQKTVENEAYITGDVIPPDVFTEADRKIENSVINKSADYQRWNDYIDWNIVINSNAIPMGKVEIEDILQEGLALDTISIELYKGNLNAENGNITKGDKVNLNKDNYSYDFSTREFVFKFTNEVDSPYILSFRTDVVDKSKQPFTNKANLKGSKTSQDSSTNPIYVEFQSGGGGAVGTRGTITVKKVDAENTNNKLKGAKFNLLDRDKIAIATGETDENGNLTFNKIRFDIPYYVEEVTPPEGYTLSEKNIYEFEIKSSVDSKKIEYTFENTIIKANLELLKLDENNNPLKGAEFTIYDAADKGVTKGTTDENGVVKFEKLVYGNYYYVETKAPEGYILNSTKHPFTISENGAVIKETVNNEKILGNIKVVKVDEDNKFLLNAEITLFDSQGKKVQSLVSNENGEVTFDNIPYGDYEVKETKAPEGYNISKEVLKVRINGEETGLIYEAGKITNTKIKADIKINKLDQDENKVVGAEFTLYNNNDEVIGTTVTNEDGIAVFEDVVYGDYYIKETKTPEGYIGTDEKFDVSIKENNGDKSIEIENTRIKGNIEISKNDGNNNPLKGAEFTIYDSFDKEVAKATTDENGIAKFEDLVYGNYYYIETKAPEGYLLKTDKHDFTINENGITLKETIVNERILGNIKAFKIDEDNKFLANAELTLFDSQGNEVQSLVTNENGEVTFENIPYGDYEVKETKAPEGYNISEEILKVSVNGEESGLVYEAGKITNTKIKADIKINKLDQDGNKVIGAEFTLYNSTDEVNGTAVTNEDGIAVFEDVVYGDYYIKETKTPEGYIGTDEKIEVSVKDNNSVYSYEIENTRIKGTVEIKKVDENGNPLKGAEFTLYNKDGKEISKSISDENGVIRFEAVDYGKYILKETKAPEGYIKDDIEVEVVIDSSKTQVFTFKNVKMKEAVNNGNIDNNNSLGKGNLPSTGDVFDVRLFILVGLALIVIGSGLLFKKKLKLNK